MNPYLYIEEDSFFHRLDPRAKLIFMVSSFFVLPFLIEQLWLTIAWVVAQFVLTCYAKAMPTLKRVRIFMIMLCIINLISWIAVGRGPTKLFWFVSLEAILQGISAGVRVVSGVVVALLILSTTRNEELVQGLIGLRVPYRGAFAFSSALRMVPTFLNSVYTVIAAQRSRGLDFESGSIFKRIKKILPMIVPAFLIALRSTDPFSMAVESKGFSSKEPRTSYFQLKMKRADWILIAVSIAQVVFAIVCNVNNWFVVFNKL